MYEGVVSMKVVGAGMKERGLSGMGKILRYEG